MRKRFSSFLTEQLLLEYDRDKTWGLHGPQVLKHVEKTDDNHNSIRAAKNSMADVEDPKLKAEISKDIMMNHFEKADPTSNKKYVPQIARIYGKGGINRLEDLHSRLKPALAAFHDLNNKKKIAPEHRDIGKVASLSHLEDIVDKHKDVVSGTESDKNYHNKMKSQSTITDHPDFTHIVPHTVESAQHFGKGTKWCTATRDTKDSMFDYYHKDGPLQIYQPKKPAYAGEKYQYHHSSGQLMNPHDEDATGHIERNHPAIHQHIQDYTKSVENNLDFDHPETAARGHAYANSHDADKIASVLGDTTKNHNERLGAANNPNLTGSHIHDFFNNHNSDSDYDSDSVAERLSSHPNLQNHTIKQIVNNKSIYGNALANAVNHKNSDRETTIDALNKRLANGYTPSHIRKILEHNPHLTGSDLEQFYNVHSVKNPNATSDVLDRALKQGDDSVIAAAARNPNLHHDQITKLMSHEDPYVTSAVIQNNPNIETHHLDKALDHPEVTVGIGRGVVTHPKATTAILHKAFDKTSWGTSTTALEHPNADSALFDKALNHSDKTITANLLHHPTLGSKVTSYHLHQIMRRSDSDHDLKSVALEHPGINAEHLHTAIDHSPDDTLFHYDVLDHPKANRSHFDKAHGHLKTEKPEAYEALAKHGHPKAYNNVNESSIISFRRFIKENNDENL